MKTREEKTPINIMLADDDTDDRFFFAKALKELSLKTNLLTVEDGERLLNYLTKHSEKLPDILFLDLNMPRRNGSECLDAIRSNEKTKNLPVIIYSTFLDDTIADLLYQKGAHYYMRKCDYSELAKQLLSVLTLLAEKNFKQPSRDKFILCLQEV